MRPEPAAQEIQESTTRWRGVFLSAAVAFVHVGGVLPLGWLLAFYGFIVRVRISADIWPTPSAGFDRFSFPFDRHETLVSAGVFFLPLFFVSWAVAAGGWSLVAPGVLPFRRFLGLLSIWLTSAVLIFIDPGHFVAWYFFSSN